MLDLIRATIPTSPRSFAVKPNLAVCAFIAAIPAHSVTCLAATQVSTAAGLDRAELAIREHSESKPLALLIDTPSISAHETESFLHAIEDRRRSGGVTVAIVGPVSEGSTLVALACDAIVTIPAARLVGADSAWCASPSRREDLMAATQRLARIPESFARRLLDTAGSLSWDKRAGFSESASGAVLLASEGTPIELSLAQLEQTGLSVQSFKSAAEATAAIDAGVVRVRAAISPPIASSAGGTSSGGPSNPTPRPGSTNPPSAPATNPGGSAVAAEKLAPKLKEYQTQLEDLKSKVTEFDKYYRGVSGVWTSKHDSLKEVWQSKTEMTRDKDTKLRCSRLQQDIREIATRIGTIARSIEKICDDKDHPEAARTRAAVEILDQFREAIQRNEVDDYEKYKPLVDRLK